MITILNRKTDRVMDFKFSEKYTQLNPYDYLEIFQGADRYLKMNELLAEYFYTYTGKEKKPSRILDCS